MPGICLQDLSVKLFSLAKASRLVVLQACLKNLAKVVHTGIIQAQLNPINSQNLNFNGFYAVFTLCYNNCFISGTEPGYVTPKPPAAYGLWMFIVS